MDGVLQLRTSRIGKVHSAIWKPCESNNSSLHSGGQYINFDLAWPSSAIPDDFFPSNVSLYGESTAIIVMIPSDIISRLHCKLFLKMRSLQQFFNCSAQDFGVWNVSYETVGCLQEWAGAKQAAALGSVNDGSSVCCPANPTVSR